ncbi:MAG TPA: allantoicase [Vicinamibacterales bacterium]|nr:allantoicase [Vicinamibacterales bacterium]
MGGDHSIPSFAALANLASARVGARAIAANDDFFAPKGNLVKPQPAVFIPGKFTARGKWMDGWESRRRRTPGHDWCVVELGMRGVVAGVDVDTSYFTGNYPSHCSIDAIDVGAAGRPPSRASCGASGAPWITILPESPLTGDAHNFFAISDARPWTHVRLNIFPDGGVARLRVYGAATIDWHDVRHEKRAIDLASIRNGGLVVGASDMHFGARDNLIMPGRAANMGDGWETRRRRGPGYDWAIVRLGAPGRITRIEIDTNHFKGNYPESASLEGCYAPGAPLDALAAASWREILRRTPLAAHKRHFFSGEIVCPSAVSHIRLNIFPDGGVSRLRVHGYVEGA